MEQNESKVHDLRDQSQLVQAREIPAGSSSFRLIHTEKLRNPAEEMHSFVGIADTAE
jgi:hypothetical protein